MDTFRERTKNEATFIFFIIIYAVLICIDFTGIQVGRDYRDEILVNLGMHCVFLSSQNRCSGMNESTTYHKTVKGLTGDQKVNIFSILANTIITFIPQLLIIFFTKVTVPRIP